MISRTSQAGAEMGVTSVQLREALFAGVGALALCGRAPVSAADFSYAVCGFLEALEPYGVHLEQGSEHWLQGEGYTFDSIRNILLEISEYRG